MAHYYYNRTTNRGNEEWSNSRGRCWITDNASDAIIQYCRKAFGRKYKDMWIDPLYFDDRYFRYTESFFSEVGVKLYPKLTNVKDALNKAGLSKHNSNSDAVRAFIRSLAEGDIDQNIKTGVKPICIIVTGVRYTDPKRKSEFIEKFTGVKRVQRLK